MLAHNLLLRGRIDFDVCGICHVGVFVPGQIRRWEPKFWPEIGFGGTAPENTDGGIVAQATVVEALSCPCLVWGLRRRRQEGQQIGIRLFIVSVSFEFLHRLETEF